MRNIFVIIAHMVLLLSCNKQINESDSNKSKQESVVIQKDSVQNETWESEEERIKKEYDKELKDFKISMQKKAFHFTCFDKCDDGVGVGYEDIQKYDLNKPFDIEKKIKEDSLTIKFKFIASCCLEYIGDVEKRNDSLLLSCKNISYTPCDCRCYYYYMFSLPMEKYKSKHITINNIGIK